MNVKNLNFQLEAFNRCIGILHNKKDLRHRELADALNISPSVLNDKMKRYLETEPPLINKQRSGKYVSYSLTKDGENYYKEEIPGTNVKNLNFQVEDFNRCIRILHNKKDLRHRELADALNISPSGLNNKMKRYLETEPPLINKQRSGKYVSYSLTKDGENYYTENIYEDNINSICQNEEEIISPEMKKVLISYILMSSDTIENQNVQILRKQDVSNICNFFSMDEFLFLSTRLGIIPEDLISENSALGYTTSSNNSEEKERWEKEVYHKFQILICGKSENERGKVFSKKSSL